MGTLYGDTYKYMYTWSYNKHNRFFFFFTIGGFTSVNGIKILCLPPLSYTL